MINKLNINDVFYNNKNTNHQKFELEYCVVSVDRGGVSGDCYYVGDVGCGRVTLMLSDGMGSGVDARQASNDVLKYMLDFKSHDMDTLNSLKYANRLCINNFESYATLDTVFVDLSTGDVELSKSGSSTTTLVLCDIVYSIDSDMLPLGIVYEYTNHVAKIKMQPNDIILLASDGITQNISEKKLKEILTQQHIIKTDLHNLRTSKTINDISNQIMTEVLNNILVDDDMTIVIARLVERDNNKYKTSFYKDTKEISEKFLFDDI